MYFGLSEEQEFFQESLLKFLNDAAPVESIREYANGNHENLTQDIHQGLLDLGVNALIIPEDFGGLGLDLLFAAAVSQSLGSGIAPETTSKIVSKSISKDGGRTSYRGLVRIEDDAYGCRSHVQCDALILDDDSISDTYPYMEVGAADAVVGHEATVSKVADEQIFYLMSRGLSEEQAMSMVVNGFIEPITRTLPMEYAVEWSRLIELQMEGSVG